jgi:hypothetical protein
LLFRKQFPDCLRVKRYSRKSKIKSRCWFIVNNKPAADGVSKRFVRVWPRSFGCPQDCAQNSIVA